MITWFRHACRALALCLTTLFVVGTPAGAATLDAPTKLVAAPTTSSVVVSWSKVANAKTYTVCLQKAKTSTSCFRTTSTANTKAIFTELKPTAGTDYFFRVTAVSGTTTQRSTLKGFDLLNPPAAPTGITHRVASSSVSVTWLKARGATSHTLCLLPSPTATTCSRETAKSTSTTAALTGLAPTSGVDHYYRVVSHNADGSTRSYAHSFDLPVPKVAGLTSKADGTHHLVLGWTAAKNASTYGVQIATNSAMTAGLINASVATTTYTSAALKPGTTYYLRVRGLNDAVIGTFSAVGTIRIGTAGTTARVVTYNLCGQDKCLNSTNKMKTWSSTRKTLAGAIVRSANADIIATQESSYDDTNFGTQLPGFKLAHHRSAKSLFYKSSKYTEVSSGSITLSSSLSKYAVWADLKDIATGTRLIAVDAHLLAGKGKSKDDERTKETTILIAAVKRINPSGLPVIYAGDYNSNASNANQSRYPGGYDAPLRAFTKAGAIDSFNVSNTFLGASYNSANQALNPPLRSFHHVDHIFTSADVKTLRWRVMVQLTGSSYVVPFASDHNPLVTDLAVPGR
ncbi:MAG: fibronectin type III domain-containing protein [Aeromicrobium sp.]